MTTTLANQLFRINLANGGTMQSAPVVTLKSGQQNASSMEVGVVLQIYFQARLRWDLWDEIISDHGGQFQSTDFARVNQRSGIHRQMYEKGHPWQNLIESQFGIQARLSQRIGAADRASFTGTNARFAAPVISHCFVAAVYGAK